MGNTIVREIAPKSLFEDALPVTDTAVSYNQGDLLVFNDTTNKIVKPALETEGATFLGVARVSVVNGKIVSPYQGTQVDAAQALVTLPGPVYGVVAQCVAKTGATFNPGDRIYLDPATGTTGVTTTGTKAIGIYQGPAIASAAAGQIVECLIGARFPSDALLF